METPTIGFIGQGFVGKSIADDFESRGYQTVRFALEEPYVKNRDKIAECDIVFLAVPTPSTPDGFDVSIVRSVLPLVGKGKIVVIKSTLVPGTADELQKEFPDIKILFSPEFLVEKTAVQDAAEPIMCIIGIPEKGPAKKHDAEFVAEHLPESPYRSFTSAREAELIKYAHNIHGVFRVIFANLLHDMAEKLGADWTPIRDAMNNDPMMSPWYNDPVHKSGRGAGGHCFIKDFKAFRETFDRLVGDPAGSNILHSLEQKNIELLLASEKDLELLEGVYGKLDAFKVPAPPVKSQTKSARVSTDGR